MESQTVSLSREVAPGVDQIGTYVPVPGLGVLPINAFVLHARQPMLIDAGVVALADPTLAAVREAIDLSALSYVYLTHTDPDHVGCLRRLLDEAPHVRLVTTFLGMGKLGLIEAVSPDRVLLKNPGEELDLGDRRIVVGRPPVFDAPETTWIHEPDADVLFSSDCFGAVLPHPFDSAGDVPDATLDDGLMTWTGIDVPWLVGQDRARLRERVRSMHAPRTVLGAHLPPAERMGRRLLERLVAASQVEPAPPPDQAAFEAMLRSA